MIYLLSLCISALIAQTLAVQLSPTYSVTWNVEADRITFDIVARTTGWVGLGFNSEGGMAGADIVIAGVSDGQKYIYDMRADGYEQPTLDAKQDYELLQASENATHTSLTISRLLDTNDKSDYAIGGEPLYLLWAYHKAVDAINPTQFPQHSSKGSKQLTLRPVRIQ